MNPEEMLWNCIPHPCQICKKHFQKRKCDIINDPDFKEVFNAIFATKIKKDYKVAVMHRDPISRPDLQKIYTSFNLEEVEDHKTKCLLTICGISVTGVGKSLEN